MTIRCQLLLSIAISFGALSTAGCGAEMVRPRPAGERLQDRPDRALIVGEFRIVANGIAEADIGMTPHQVYVGSERQGFRQEIADNGRAFALWVYPGVFCFGQPTFGTPPKVLGNKPACAEIPEAGKAFYVGTVAWKVSKQANGATAELVIDDKRESVSASQFFVGVYLEPALVSQEVQPEAVAKKYKIK
jgi:hypothetical protein